MPNIEIKLFPCIVLGNLINLKYVLANAKTLLLMFLTTSRHLVSLHCLPYMQYMNLCIKLERYCIYELPTHGKDSFSALLVENHSPNPQEKIILQIRGRESMSGEVGFVCVAILRPSQPNEVMSSAVILPNHTFSGQA